LLLWVHHFSSPQLEWREMRYQSYTAPRLALAGRIDSSETSA